MHPNIIDDSVLLVKQYAHLRDAASNETALHEAADTEGKKFDAAVQFAFAKARAELKRLLRAKKVANYTSVLGILKKSLADVLPSRLHALVVVGGHASAGMMRHAEEFRVARTPKKRIGPFQMSFDGDNPEAVDWADKHAAELIDGILETTRERINNAVAEYLETRDWETFYDEIVDSVGEDRAYTIARHEPMVAVHEGQREAWAQAEDEGLLSGDEKVVWIITGDDKVCPTCLDLDGKTRDLDGVYTGSDGETYDGPPAHVLCRCTEGITG